MDAGTSSLPRSAVGCRDAAKRHPCTPLRQHRPLKFERLNPADRGIQCKFRPICLHIPIYRPNFATSHFYSPLVQSIANLPPANTARAKTDMNVQTQTEPSNAMDDSIDPYATTHKRTKKRMNLAKKDLETIQRKKITETHLCPTFPIAQTADPIRM